MDTVTKDKIDQLVKSNNTVLFMKGTPSAPQCGFSAQAIGILQNLGAEFEYCNVLEDEAVRQGIKEYGNWPTIPQLYIKQELVGGSDILLEMYDSGELKDMLKS